MKTAVRFKLHFGPYRSPRFRVGKTVTDEWRGDVKIIGVSNARIPWPIGQTVRAKSLVVYAGLAKAIRRESMQAVAYWFGVTPQTVTKWRNRVGIAGEKLNGTTRLRQVYSQEPWALDARAKAHAKARDPQRRAKIAASRLGRKRPKHVVEALRKANLGRKHSESTRQKMSAAHKRRGTRPPWLGPGWSESDDLLVQTLPIGEVARRTGRSVGAVSTRRYLLRRLGVEIPDGRRRG